MRHALLLGVAQFGSVGLEGANLRLWCQRDRGHGDLDLSCARRSRGVLRSTACRATAATDAPVQSTQLTKKKKPSQRLSSLVKFECCLLRVCVSLLCFFRPFHDTSHAHSAALCFSRFGSALGAVRASAAPRV